MKCHRAPQVGGPWWAAAVLVTGYSYSYSVTGTVVVVLIVLELAGPCQLPGENLSGTPRRNSHTVTFTTVHCNLGSLTVTATVTRGHFRSLQDGGLE
jgi:hypothetical protein